MPGRQKAALSDIDGLQMTYISSLFTIRDAENDGDVAICTVLWLTSGWRQITDESSERLAEISECWNERRWDIPLIRTGSHLESFAEVGVLGYRAIGNLYHRIFPGNLPTEVNQIEILILLVTPIFHLMPTLTLRSLHQPLLILFDLLTSPRGLFRTYKRQFSLRFLPCGGAWSATSIFMCINPNWNFRPTFNMNFLTFVNSVEGQ